MASLFHQHWEKFALGGVASLALIFLGASSGSNPAVRELDEIIARYHETRDTRVNSIPSPVIDPPPVINAPPPAFVPPGPPSPPRVSEPPPPKAVWILPELALKPAASSVDGVTLSWNLIPPKPAPGMRTITPDSNTYYFKLQRRLASESEWKVLRDELKSFEFLDTDAIPNREYRYEVRLGFKDPSWVHLHPDGLTDRSASAAARTPRAWEFEFSQVHLGDSEKGIKGNAYVRIVKYDRELGLVELRKVYVEGAALGLSGGSTTHVVQSPKKGRPVSADFKSGAVLRAIRIGRPVPYARKVCTPRLNAQNLLVCGGPAVIQDSYDVIEVDYLDEDGAPRVHRAPVGLGPQPDRLCGDHR